MFCEKQFITFILFYGIICYIFAITKTILFIMKSFTPPPRGTESFHQLTTRNQKIIYKLFCKLFIICFVLHSANAFSQSPNWWKTDGNSNGSNNTFIGTTNNASLRFRANNIEFFSINPQGEYTFNTLTGNGTGLMQINSTGKAQRLNYSNNANDVLTGMGTWVNVNSLFNLNQHWQSNNSGIYTTNYVGIGNSNPQYALDVNGIAQFNHKIFAYRICPIPGDSLIRFGDSTITLNNTTNNINWTGIWPNPLGLSIGNCTSQGTRSIAIGDFTANSGTYSITIGKGVNGSNLLSNSTNNSLIIDFNSNIPTLFVSPANGVNTLGKVGIGTTTPAYLLDVADTIRACRLIAEAVSWCDYVFADNYKPMSLAQLESHIKTRKHLPYIPTEKEVSENGVDIVEMQKGLLKTLEEYTLHLIEMKKENEQLKQELQEIKTQIESLKEKK